MTDYIKHKITIAFFNVFFLVLSSTLTCTIFQKKHPAFALTNTGWYIKFHLLSGS